VLHHSNETQTAEELVFGQNGGRFAFGSKLPNLRQREGRKQKERVSEWSHSERSETNNNGKIPVQERHQPVENEEQAFERQKKELVASFPHQPESDHT
jgi:hypothetical protein